MSISSDNEHNSKNSNSNRPVKKRRRPHKVFGEYVKIKVNHKIPLNRDTSIFIGINDYNIEFKPDTEVSVPIKIVEFIEKTGHPVYSYDPNKVSDNGNVGAHVSIIVPSYIVQRL